MKFSKPEISGLNAAVATIFKEMENFTRFDVSVAAVHHMEALQRMGKAQDLFDRPQDKSRVCSLSTLVPPKAMEVSPVCPLDLKNLAVVEIPLENHVPEVVPDFILGECHTITVMQQANHPKESHWSQ